MQFIQDIFIQYYDWRPFRSMFLNKLTGNGSKVLGVLANVILPKVFNHCSANEYYLKSEKAQVIVSMTSFPTRINNVWLVVECLLRQTLVPAHIVLYLSREQFHDFSSLPKSLKKYPPQILDIRLVDGDIKSHKKYWYALHDFPQFPIITVDDDIVYDSNLVRDLINSAEVSPTTIPCCFSGHMSWNKDGSIKPYSEWSSEDLPFMERDPKMFFGSGGGTLFPVGSLKGATESWETLKEICPTADDIWLNAITRMNGYYPMKIRKRKGVPEWKIKNNTKLSSINNGKKANDVQLESVQRWCLMNRAVNPFDKRIE